MNPENNELFRKKYRTKSIRLQGWHYSSYGAYFITICTKDRVENLGEIRNGIMGLNNLGCIVAQFWQKIPTHFSEIELDEWVIMPNHMHAIMWVTGYVETIHELSLRNDPKFRRKMLIPKMVGRFKMQTAKQINLLQGTSGQSFWQKDYYERIVRDDDELNAIRRYIRENPIKWHRDRNNFNPPVIIKA